MPRKTKVVSKGKLQKAIDSAESNGPLENRSKLWEQVTTLYNADNPPEEITTSVTGLRFKQFKLTCITPKGKRGRQGALSAEQKAKMQEGRKAAGPRKSRGEKFAQRPDFEAHVTALKEHYPERFHNLVDQVTVKGSMKAAVKAQCVECMGFVTKGVKDCAILVCPLYLFRPFQDSNSDPDIDTSDQIDSPDSEENNTIE